MIFNKPIFKIQCATLYKKKVKYICNSQCHVICTKKFRSHLRGGDNHVVFFYILIHNVFILPPIDLIGFGLKRQLFERAFQ
jgi:hypothetical protein